MQSIFKYYNNHNTMIKLFRSPSEGSGGNQERNTEQEIPAEVMKQWHDEADKKYTIGLDTWERTIYLEGRKDQYLADRERERDLAGKAYNIGFNHGLHYLTPRSFTSPEYEERKQRAIDSLFTSPVNKEP